MNVIVDTSVWSEFLRRKNRHSESVRSEVGILISSHRALLLGPIRQELLSGVKTEDQFKALRARLRSFPDHTIAMEDYEKAGEFFNLCRRKGIQGSFTDFLICAVAVNQHVSVYTVDKDFMHYSKMLPLKLHSAAR